MSIYIFGLSCLLIGAAGIVEANLVKELVEKLKVELDEIKVRLYNSLFQFILVV